MANRTWARIAAAYAGLVLVMAAIGAVAGGGEDADPIEALTAPEPRAAFPLEMRSPQVVGGSNLRVLVALRRPALGELPEAARTDAADQRAYVRSLSREARALRSALEARGVTFGDPVVYARVWAGFAATVSTRDLNEVQAAGLRVERVRRFYPAAAGAASGEGATGKVRGAHRPGLRLRAAPTVAVLDSAVDRSHPRLRGRVQSVADAIRVRATAAGRRDEHGTQIAGALAARLPSSARLLAIRVAGLQARPAGGGLEESGTTDQLLDGLERAVDPDGDGDSDDAAPVALVGVASPYAGFDRAPEGEAVGAAARLGTLTVAPAGNQGPGGGRYGTIASPAAAPAALAVGALAGPRAVPVATISLAAPGGSSVASGELIAGPARAAEGRVTTRVRNARRAILVAGGDPVAAARAATEAGAAALVVCSPAAPPPLLAVDAATIPVVGLTGDAARDLLASARTGTGAGRIAVGSPRRVRVGAHARSSASGPTYSLTPKPDAFAPGSAVLPRAGGGEGYAAGTSVAAAAVAAEAALLRAARPELDAEEATALLVETAGRDGVPAAGRAASARLVALPHTTRVRAGASAVVRLRNLGPRRRRVLLRAPGLRVARTVTVPARGERRVRIAAPRGARTGERRLVAEGLTVRVAVPPPPLRARIGSLQLVRERGAVTGVRFAAGRVGGAPARPVVEPVGALVLRLVGPEQRELTPPGGARDLLPGEYAYTLSPEVRGGLPPGSYRFVVRARGPAGGPATGRRSPPFPIR